LGYGGTERVIALLADGLVARGHEVTLFAAAGSDTAARLVSPLCEPPALIGGAPDDDVFHTLHAYLAADEFDVIHDHTSLGPAFSSLLPDGPPVVHTLHGPWTDGLRRKLALVQGTVQLVAISHAQAAINSAIEYAGVVHNGIDLDRHPFCDRKEDFLVFVGRVNADKAPEVAVEISREVGLPLTMMVKRSEPEEWEYWNAVVAPLLHDGVEVLEQPPHATKVDLVGRARATLCPINWPEPFGLVLAESLACGTPVITRPLGAAPEIVTHGVTGFLCDTTEQMIAAVGRLDAISPRTCRDHAAERFSAASMVTGYEAVYRSVERGTRSSSNSSSVSVALETHRAAR
jgi:glycosyltransferase involved in cell wall biosynthesis